jgi:hypothetical protein
MKITLEQRKAIKEVVQYSIENERKDLEETLYTISHFNDTLTPFDGIEFDSMSNKELNIFCEENSVVHIWNYLYELSLIG